MIEGWDSNIVSFIELCNKHGVRLLMVGGGAVNFHGYQRHSADVDFWIDTSQINLDNLLLVLQEMKYDVQEFPESIQRQEQNISLKFSPESMYIELITRFSINKPFDEAFNHSEPIIIKNHPLLKWNVLNLEDLITSKIKSGRPKDFLDIQELQRIHKKSK